ncbi:hypothetical protein GCM10008959_06410 [Deinococcus seoulensis]|uniref:HEAT repeat domain-containing protein n=1 Tax=Deinococcus seoulensis TaxID=1837379 RepID=A0ABQ2RLU5_9DEIO|nr:hypothetical protein [Deinococcus seoulensis]GGR47929.1 hypothetical protein GCM10008959_06410 [Deinococcus seoulensis]
MSVFPQDFTRRLQRAGVGRVQFAYHWHSDERHLDLEVLDEDGQALTLTSELEGEIREAVWNADLGTFGTYLWDLASGEVMPFGQLTYLTGDVLGGTYQVTFTGDPEKTLAARSTPDPTRAQVNAWVASPDPKLRVAVAGNLSVPDAWVTPLLGDLDPLVVQVMAARPGRAPLLSTHLTDAGNPMTLPRALDTLARSEWAQVRRAVAANPSTPGRTLADLAGDPEWRIRLATLSNPSVGDDVRSALLAFFSGADVNLRRTVARNEPIPPDLLGAYATDPDPTVRAAVMGRADLPGDLLQKMKSDPHRLVQEALTYRPENGLEEEDSFDESWPPEEQWRVAQMPGNGELWGRYDLQMLAWAPNLLPEIRALFLTQPGMYWALLCRDDVTDDEVLHMARSGPANEWVVRLPDRTFPPAFFRTLLPQLSESEQRELVTRSDLPADVREELLTHGSPAVRASMAEKGALDEPLARRLAADPVDWVAKMLLRNRTLPPGVAREVLAHLGPGVLNPYIHTTELPPELLGVYAEVATGDVLVNLAANPCTPPLPIIEQLRSLGADGILPLLSDPTTPPGMLARLVGTEHDLLLVRHPNFMADHLHALITQSVRRHRFWNSSYGDEHRRITELLHVMLSSPFMTSDLWDTLVTTQLLNGEQRAMIASRTDLPEFIARRLKEDPVQAVARAVRRDLWPDL